MEKIRIASAALLCVTFAPALCRPALSAGEEASPAPAAPSTREIVVTASRYREGIASVPGQVTVVTEHQIRNSTARNIPELLRGVAAVHVSDIAGNSRHFTVDLRGFGESAALNTLVLVDGRKVNQADLSGTDWTLIPLEQVERIEILHGGGGSVLYGDNATGGVIHIITRSAGTRAAGAALEAGSYETLKASAYATGNLEGVAVSAAVRHLTSDGYRDNSGNDATDVDLDLAFTPSDNLVLTLGGRFHRDDAGLPGAIKTSDFAAGVSRRETVHPDDFVEVDDYDVTGRPLFRLLRRGGVHRGHRHRHRHRLPPGRLAQGPGGHEEHPHRRLRLPP
jgi:iron complex outermembrane receptor protein